MAKLEYCKRTLKHHTDAGHGWVMVSLAELATLGLTDKISEYSYLGTDCMGNKSVYLEEDGDLGIYIKRLKALGIEYSIEQGTHSNHESWIRNLPIYKGI